jgi:hypothetical protein
MKKLSTRLALTFVVIIAAPASSFAQGVFIPPQTAVSTVFAQNAAITGTVTATGFSSNQAVTFTIQAAAGTGATTPVCAAGFACTPNYGSLTFTSGSAALAVGDIVKVSWTNVFLHKSVCVVQGVDNTASGTVLTTLAVDGGSATTTAAFFYTSTALAASHSIGMNYVCF